jgi:ABC-type branched-subunit amino acid transport system permease subunit
MRIEKALGKKKPLLDREIFILAGLLLLLPWALPFKSLPAEILIYALGAVSFNILLGYTGLLSFGQAAFFGSGAYLTGLFLIHLGWHPALVLILSGIIGAIFAALIGIYLGGLWIWNGITKYKEKLERLNYRIRSRERNKTFCTYKA